MFQGRAGPNYLHRVVGMGDLFAAAVEHAGVPLGRHRPLWGLGVAAQFVEAAAEKIAVHVPQTVVPRQPLEVLEIFGQGQVIVRWRQALALIVVYSHQHP